MKKYQSAKNIITKTYHLLFHLDLPDWNLNQPQIYG